MSFFKKTASVFSVFLLLSALVVFPAGALTIREEKELADEFLKAVYNHFEVIEDQVINEYINSLGEKLTRGVPPQPFGFKFHVIQEDAFNAFAGPGGNIFVFSGLIEAMDTENELAAIMAHEIAHVTARHVPDMIQRSQKTSLVSMAGLIAGILVGLGGAPTAGTALTIGSIAAGETMALSYSRRNELQADFIGRNFLVDAGYHEYGLLSALKTIRAREWFGEEDVPTYLKTHPAAAERIAVLGNEIREKPDKLYNTYEFDRTRMRVMAIYGKRANALDRLFKLVTNRPDDPAVQYGYGLVLAEGGNPDKAVLHLKQAALLKPDDPNIDVALGRAFFLAGDNKNAMNTLKNIENIEKYGPEGIFSMGRVQMDENEIEGAVKTFRKLLYHYPGHSRAMFFLGQSLGRIGELGEAHYYLGKYHKSQKNLENARFHFDKAFAETRDPEKKAEIKDMIKNVDSALQKKG